jgi:tRNA threonylcarbamoyladenosine biosynthesis protein TsaB
MPAERNEVFAATFASRPPTGDVPSQLIAIDDWLASLVPGVHVTGPALVKLAARIPPGAAVIDETLWQPRAGDVGQLAHALFARGERQTLWELVPRYLRRSAAEEKWDAIGRKSTRGAS